MHSIRCWAYENNGPKKKTDDIIVYYDNSDKNT